MIELKDKLGEFGIDSGLSMSGEIDALEALRALGYGEREAREALKTQNKYTIAEDNWLSAMYVLHIDLHYKN